MKKLVAATFIMISFCWLGLATALANDEIRLVNYETGTGLGCYGRCGYISASIKVKNIAYEKLVTIFFRLNDGEWHELPAYYFGPLESGFEEWKIDMNVGERGQHITFVVRYEVAGHVYWDNNSTHNYQGDLN